MRQGRLIHLIDDHDAIRRSVSFLLKNAGFSVTGWASGEDFLQAIDPDQPACVILDIQMPFPDGITVQRELAKRRSALPVIMITGHLERGIVLEAFRAGAMEVIAKPFERGHLLAAVEAGFQRASDPGEIERQARRAAHAIGRLDQRDLLLLREMASGRERRDLATVFGVSMPVLELWWADVLAKLDARDLLEAIRLAVLAELPSGPPWHPSQASHFPTISPIGSPDRTMRS